MKQEQDYDPAAIEAKWQARWEAEGTNSLTDAQLASAPRPFYNLMMFPYPSAEGLHVGNLYAFTGADIHGRWKRLLGVFVFIGFTLYDISNIARHGVPQELVPMAVLGLYLNFINLFQFILQLFGINLGDD